jgi:hypothetical protein
MIWAMITPAVHAAKQQSKRHSQRKPEHPAPGDDRDECACDYSEYNAEKRNMLRLHGETLDSSRC